MRFQKYINEAKTVYVSFPSNKIKTTDQMVQWFNSLPLDAKLKSDDMYDPETGEILWDSKSGKSKRHILRDKAKQEIERKIKSKEKFTPIFLDDEMEYDSFYFIKKEDISKSVDDPEKMRAGDYDIDWSVPVFISRKDRKPFDETDVDNIENYIDWYNKHTLPFNIELNVHVKSGDKKTNPTVFFK